MLGELSRSQTQHCFDTLETNRKHYVCFHFFTTKWNLLKHESSPKRVARTAHCRAYRCACVCSSTHALKHEPGQVLHPGYCLALTAAIFAWKTGWSLNFSIAACDTNFIMGPASVQAHLEKKRVEIVLLQDDADFFLHLGLARLGQLIRRYLTSFGLDAL